MIFAHDLASRLISSTHLGFLVNARRKWLAARVFIARAQMSFGKRRGALVQTEIRLARDQDVESFVADRAVSLVASKSCSLSQVPKTNTR